MAMGLVKNKAQKKGFLFKKNPQLGIGTWKLCSATLKGYDSGPNVSTLLSSIFRGDQKLLRDYFDTLANQH